MIRALLVAATLAAAGVGVSAPANAQPRDAVWDLIPAGYDSDSCIEIKGETPWVVVDCWDNFLPGGPEDALYARHLDQSTLVGEFNRVLEDLVIVPCPGGLPSPGAWYQDWAPNVAAGQVVCATFMGDFRLIWTRDSDLFMGDAAPSHANRNAEARLIDWWRANGTVAPRKPAAIP